MLKFNIYQAPRTFINLQIKLLVINIYQGPCFEIQ
jgi:hypothetical protein